MLDRLGHRWQGFEWLGVGVGQCRFIRGGVHAQVPDFSEAAGQTAADFPQALCLCELAEQHRHEMIPAAETFCLSCDLMTVDEPTEFSPIEHGEQLAEQACMPYHWASSLFAGMVFVLVEQFAPQGAFFSNSD